MDHEDIRNDLEVTSSDINRLREQRAELAASRQALLTKFEAGLPSFDDNHRMPKEHITGLLEELVDHGVAQTTIQIAMAEDEKEPGKFVNNERDASPEEMVSWLESARQNWASVADAEIKLDPVSRGMIIMTPGYRRLLHVSAKLK